MKTILWSQNESPEKESIILINGRKSSDKLEWQKAFSELSNMNQDLLFSESERIQIQSRYGSEKFAHQANIRAKRYINKPVITFYIQGNYLTRDCVGRKMAFMFLCQIEERPTLEQSYLAVVNHLKQFSSSINRQCNDDELAILWQEAVAKSLKEGKRKRRNRLNIK